MNNYRNHVIRAGDGDTITLFCGLKKIPLNSFISSWGPVPKWKNCRWIRTQKKSNCTYEQIHNITQNHFEIIEHCQSDIRNVKYVESRSDASQVGDELCGIKIIAADVRDSGVWSCCLDYGDDVGCSAQGEYWLSVKSGI